MAEIRINPVTKQVETLTPEGIWSASALEGQVGFAKKQVKEMAIQTSVLAEEDLAKTQKAIGPIDGVIPEYHDVQIQKGTDRIQISTKDLDRYLSEGYQVVPFETTAKQVIPVDGALPPEVLEDGEKTDEEKEADKLASGITDIDSQITVASANIAKVQSSIKDDSAYEETGEIRNIRLEYERRKDEVRRLGEIQKQALQTMAFRWGTAQYAPAMLQNLMGGYELELTRRVNDLKGDEDRAVNAMKTAIRKEDYKLYLDEKEKLEKLREKKISALGDLNKEIKKKNDEMEKAQEKAKMSILINDLDKQGKTASEIYDAINFDSKGNMIPNPMSIAEIQKAIEDVKITDDVRIKNIDKFFGEKTEGITSEDYLQAQKDWLASGGTIADFKSAYPPDSILEENELKKLPKSVWTPAKPEELTEAGKLKFARQTMNSRLDSVKGGDGYISPEDWSEAKRSWIAEGLNANDFINQFYIYINPTHPEDYGQREANYIRGIGEGGTSNPFE